VRDAELKPKIAATHAANYGVFGEQKACLTLNREGKDVAGLLAHHDHGSQYLFVATPSISTWPASNPRPGRGFLLRQCAR
jgi:hypothetical protein